MAAVRFRYQRYTFDDFDVHIRSLKDRNQFDDPRGEAARLGISSAQWPLFGMMWASAIILARQVEHMDVQGLRILEVGCGLGLASLVLQQRAADITASDYHPEVEAYLSVNSDLNTLEHIPFERCDWSSSDDELGTFDLIIGSDVLYERQHAEILAPFIDHHAGPACAVLLVDPGRGHHSHFSKAMLARGYTFTLSRLMEADYSGVVLQYARTDNRKKINKKN